MKLEIQVEKNGYLTIVAVAIMLTSVSVYYIYRETEIRRILVERVKSTVDPSTGYGNGAMQRVDEMANRLKRNSGGIKAPKVYE